MGRIIRVQPGVVDPVGGYLIGDGNTVLAIGRIGDCSGQGHEIQIKGDPSFGNQAVTNDAEFDAVRNAGREAGFLWGGSEFDGSGDWHEMPDHDDFNLGSSDFTIDVWFRTSSTDIYMFSHDGYTVIGNANYKMLTIQNGKLMYIIRVINNNLVWLESADSVNDGLWHHACIVRESDFFVLYLDGINVDSVTYSITISDYSNPVGVGVLISPPYYSRHKPFNGDLKNIRFCRYAVWTSDFTPPTDWQTDYLDQVTADTKLLLPMHGDTAYGHSPDHNVHDLSTAGEPVIQAVTLGGGKETSCIVFDGVNDFMGVSGTETGIESIDFWAFSDTNTRDILKLSASAKVSVDGSGNIALTGMANWQVLVDGSVGASIGTATWKHVGLRKNTGSAVTMDGGEIGRSTTYFDGKIANVRMQRNELDFASLWTNGRLYTLEDAY